MGKGREKTWRFELHDSSSHISPGTSSSARSGGSGRSGGRSQTSSGHRAVTIGTASDPAWADLDVGLLHELAPHLPSELIHDVVAQRQAAGSGVQEAIDALLSLNLDAAASPEITPLSDARPPGHGKTPAQLPWLARLPDVLISLLCEQVAHLSPPRHVLDPRGGTRRFPSRPSACHPTRLLCPLPPAPACARGRPRLRTWTPGRPPRPSRHRSATSPWANWASSATRAATSQRATSPTSMYSAAAASAGAGGTNGCLTLCARLQPAARIVNAAALPV